MILPPIECAACRAGLPMIWSVQAKKYMHEAQGLSVTPCAVLEEQDRRAKAIAKQAKAIVNYRSKYGR